MPKVAIFKTVSLGQQVLFIACNYFTGFFLKVIDLLSIDVGINRPFQKAI